MPGSGLAMTSPREGPGPELRADSAERAGNIAAPIKAQTEDMTEERAEQLTKIAGEHLDAMADAYEQVLPIMRELYEGQAFRVLGYKSHGAYVLDRFGGSLARLGIDARRLAVRELTNQGMSVRAIAGVLGVSVGTVHNDRSDVFSREQLPELITGLDGKVRPAYSTKSETELDRLIAEDDDHLAAWQRGEVDLIEGSLWERYCRRELKLSEPWTWEVNAAICRSYNKRLVAFARLVRDSWDDWADEAEKANERDRWPFDTFGSWQELVRDGLHIDPYAAAYAGIIDDPAPSGEAGPT
jgi:hypothetical protein